MRTHTTQPTGNETRRALLGLPPRSSQATHDGTAAASTPRQQRARLFLLIDQDAPSPFALVPVSEVALLESYRAAARVDGIETGKLRQALANVTHGLAFHAEVKGNACGCDAEYLREARALLSK